MSTGAGPEREPTGVRGRFRRKAQTAVPVAAHLSSLMPATNQEYKVRRDWRQALLLALHIATIAGAVLLVYMVSRDALHAVSFLSDPLYLRLQLCICLVFLADILAEIAFSARRGRALLANLPFLIVCIPYLSILPALGISLSGQLIFVLRFVPMVRAAGVFAVLTGLITQNRVGNVFRAYIVLLVTLIYFASLMFFVEEHGVNPGVSSYGRTLWWAVMCMTTTGSNIVAYTDLGKTLSIVLAGAGLILIPMLTVYITNVASAGRSSAEKSEG